MKKLFVLFVLVLLCSNTFSQNLATIKKELEATDNPLGYVKYKLKKKYVIDTITVLSTTEFLGVADSLAYKGKVGKVYGPFKKGNYLIKVLAKLPNTFYHVSHIVLDTAIFREKFAENLADTIISKIKTGRSTFANMAKTYSSDNVSSGKGGDLGWFIRGFMLPQLDDAIATHKKGEIFKVWTDIGLHIVTITDKPKEDNGFALLLRVLL
ncbi:peptidylprolyl isomerase [Ferruginibacter sp. SUN002]|uniref:peptidylprolyl isomerase n=1 Tax=Ferruginibacter sp. SUN002 TaxID=2937789 RepID=UPI003D36B25B